MQKKLYFLDEQEKNRILNLHESRTKEQYLNENVFSDLFKTLGGNINIAGWEKYPCVVNSKNVKPVLRDDKTVMFVGGGFNWFGNGRRANISTGKMDSYSCGPDGKIQEGPSGWQKYYCVLQQAGAIDYESRQTPNDTTNWIQVGQFVYSKEGKKFKDGDNKNQTDYSCETEFKTQQQGSQQGYQQVAGGYILSPFTTNAVNQIRTSIGITGQGGLNQTDINQLYAKIATLPNKQ